jgi:hypothetical protein
VQGQLAQAQGKGLLTGGDGNHRKVTPFRRSSSPHWAGRAAAVKSDLGWWKVWLCEVVQKTPFYKKWIKQPQTI